MAIGQHKKLLKMNCKQIFCNHIYKEDKKEYLSSSREIIQGLVAHTYSNYEYYAIYSTCLKCNKNKISKTRKLIL